jgi:DNA-binding NarL/FixJ family response regulator
MGARILIADDDRLTRTGLRLVLGQEADLEVVAEARDGREAIELAERLQPDLVLMDLRMPRMDGLEATLALKRDGLASSVLILSMIEDPTILSQAVHAGAVGYVLKTANEAELRFAVRQALAGGEPVEPPMTRELAARAAPTSETVAAHVPNNPLSPREQQVLRLLARGRTNREIASELSITQHTVKVHVEHILSKLQVSHRTHAAVRAMELGYLRTSDESAPRGPGLG